MYDEVFRKSIRPFTIKLWERIKWHAERVFNFSARIKLDLMMTWDSGGIHKNLFYCFSCDSHVERSTLHTDTRYIRDYVSRMSSADETIPPERRSFPDRSFYGRRNNSVVISREFEKTRPSAGDFLKPGVILVCFISGTANSRKLTTEWDVTFSRYATWTATRNCRPDSL